MDKNNDAKDGFVADRRRNKRINYGGIAVFVGLRLSDCYLQYGILRHGWGSRIIHALGGRTLPPDAVTRTLPLLDSLKLSPYRLILLAMSAGSAIKQAIHASVISNEEFTPGMSVGVSVLNTFFNSLNSLFFICAATSASNNGQIFPQTPLIVGASLYVVGVATELYSEYQRKLFKDNPVNKGKLWTRGLFGLSRHINYFGYLLWRTGYAVAAGGWLWGAFNASLALYGFVAQSIPELEGYTAERYGAQWRQYEQTCPYKLIPYVY